MATTLFTILAAVLAVAAPATAGTERVTPGKKQFLLLGPGSRSYSVKVDLAEAPPSSEPIDVLFLFDMTASMENVAQTVRESAMEIMRSIRTVSENSAFAVAVFTDYPLYDAAAASPWTLHGDLTLDLAAAAAALQKVHVEGSGGDAPEAYTRALFEAKFLSWRRDSRRFVILFGDAPAHDTDFYGTDLGLDPGRDGRPGTADDLRLREVIAGLAANHILVNPVYDAAGESAGKPYQSEARKGFEFMASQTGGVAKKIASASEIPAAIEAGVREGYSPTPRLEAGPELRSWVAIGNVERDAGSKTRFRFPVDLNVPQGADGVYRVPLYGVFGDASDPRVIGRSDAIVRVGLLGLPWYWLGGLLWLLLLLLVFVARAGTQSSRRYRLLERYRGISAATFAPLLALLLCIAVPAAIWMWAPGRVPPSPAVAAGPGAR